METYDVDFDHHFLFTYQKPTYKKYETSVTFSDGYVGQINATGNIVAEKLGIRIVNEEEFLKMID